MRICVTGTACVCECLARLPSVASESYAGVLQLLYQELLRAVYVDIDQLGRSGRRVDAQALVRVPLPLLRGAPHVLLR